MVIGGSVRPFLYRSVYSCHLLLISSASVRSYYLCPLSCPSLMKCSLGITKYSYRDLQSFPFSYFPLFFFFFIAHLKRPSYLFLLFPGTLHSVGYIFPFLPGLSLFFPQLFVKPPQSATLPSCISFFFGVSLVLPPVQCYEPPSIVLCTLPDLIPWIYSSPPLYNHKGFDLGHTWIVWWFSYFLQLGFEFGNKEFMISVTVSS